MRICRQGLTTNRDSPGIRFGRRGDKTIETGIKLWKRRARRILLVVAAILCAAAIAGSIYELVSERKDARRFPQEGRSVDVGGFRLNIHCTGAGEPAVILDSGLGIPAMGWDLVQPGVEKFTRVCSYDRAGYGWSDPGRLPRTSRQIGQELHVLLQNAGVQPPYILVGHSFGGFNVRVFNGLYPDEVVGVVLVDSTQVDQQAIVTTASDAERRDDAETLLFARIYPVLFHLGAARVFLASDRTPLPEHLDAGLRYLLLQPAHVRAMVDEGLTLSRTSSEQVRESGTLGNKPLVVLTAGSGHTKDGADLQRKLTQLSTHSQQIVVQDSGHLIPFERPQVIVDAIQSVFDTCRDSR